MVNYRMIQQIARRRVLLGSLYLLYLVLLVEIASRSYLVIRHGLPFFGANKSTLFYPELKALRQQPISANDGRFDILMLGGSVLYTSQFSNIEPGLIAALSHKTEREIRIHDLARPGHSSRDSYLKYKQLDDQHFDLVLVCHGINDVRANKCPPALFKLDYSHMTWYALANTANQTRDGLLFEFPFISRYLWMRAKQRLGIFIQDPIQLPPQKWLVHGSQIKTAVPFEQNLTGILEIAQGKQETILLSTFAYYVPAGYTQEKFINKSLDYGWNFCPIEIWGMPENVIAGIEQHNTIIRKLAGAFDHVKFVDMENLMPNQGIYFKDICHLSDEGCSLFVENIRGTVLEVIRQGEFNRE